jgi:hypothetical protein
VVHFLFMMQIKRNILSVSQLPMELHALPLSIYRRCAHLLDKIYESHYFQSRNYCFLLN